MNTYDISQIIKMWEHVEITQEQAIGQIMLHLQQLGQRVTQLERLQGIREQPPGDGNKGQGIFA